MKFSQPIAIVGRGGVFPGAGDLEEFWSNIKGGIDSSREVPPGRWIFSTDEVYDSQRGAKDKVYSKRGCFLENFPPQFDCGAIDQALVSRLDMVFQLALYGGITAFRDGVTKNLDLSRTGVILGNIVLPTEKTSLLTASVFEGPFKEKILSIQDGGFSELLEPLNRYVAGFPAGLLAKALHLGGGSYTLDSACASSLYALKLACDDLLSHRADAMLAGGLARPDCLYTQMGFGQLLALSPTGICAPFDSKGNGLVVGEGVGIFLLKRLESALRDGDFIYGNIMGIGLSNDVGGSLLSPDKEGQLRAMRSAYNQAGWLPQDVDLIECHGTGTPVGDKVEFESLCELWGGDGGNKNLSVIGSVKSNVGHLLTGAGSAGLMKILLALQHKTLPPTANFEKPNPKINLNSSPFQVLFKSKPWAKRDEKTPRRAALSAFGFGGINGHVLLEEWEPSTATSISFPAKRDFPEEHQDIAIVGLDGYFGPWTTLQAFQERVLGSTKIYKPHPARGWWGIEESSSFAKGGWNSVEGFYVDEFSVPLGKFRIPPREMKEMLPQQLLMLLVMSRAIHHSGYKEEEGLNTGVFVGISLDLNTTNFHFRWHVLKHGKKWMEDLGLKLSPSEREEWLSKLADCAHGPLTADRTMGALGGIVASRIAREFRVGGQGFTLSSEESSGLTALKVAVDSLRKGDLDQAFVGAVDLSGDIRTVQTTHKNTPYSTDGKTRPFQQDSQGPLVGEGAVAVVLKRLEDAKKDGHTIYGIIKGVGSAGGGDSSIFPDKEVYKKSLARVFGDGKISPQSISYIETHGSGNPQEDRVEARALTEFFKAEQRERPCALGSVKPSIGHSGAAGGLASLVKTALALHRKILPSFENAGHGDSEFPKSHFYFPSSSGYWLQNRSQGPRRALVSSMSIDGNCCHFLLEEYPENKTSEFHGPLGKLDRAIFSIEGDQPAEILAQLDCMEKKISPSSDLEILAQSWWKNHPLNSEKKLGLSLVATSVENLSHWIKIAKKHLRENPDRPLSPHQKNIFYQPNPLGKDAKKAFVFPGSGNHYPGMGQQLSRVWPEIFQEQNGKNNYFASQFAPEILWHSPSKETMSPHPQALILGQVSLGILVSDLLKKFRLTPDSAIGYSLGESAALFALGAWQDRDEMFRRIKKSSLFVSDMAGSFDAVRKVWNLGDHEKVNWSVGVVNCPAEQVRRALKNRESVYLLIVNTPQECVVGGDQRALGALVADLKANFFPLEGITAVHCEVAKPVEKQYWDLHKLVVTPPMGIQFYSSAWGKTYSLDSKRAADSMLAQALGGFDFPKVIDQAYKDGNRIFIEIGPGNSTSRFIGKILGDRPHLALSACYSGQDEVLSILSLLGNLIAHRVSVDLDFLYSEKKMVQRAKKNDSPFLSIEVAKKGFTTGNFNFLKDHLQEKKPSLKQEKSLPLAKRFCDLQKRETPMASPLLQNFSPATEKKNTSSVKQNPFFLSHSELIQQMEKTEEATSQAHSTFIEVSQGLTETLAKAMAFQMSLLGKIDPAEKTKDISLKSLFSESKIFSPQTSSQRKYRLPREMCMEFALGSIEKVFGPSFSQVDTHPTRVRLPGEPLMLVHGILTIEGEVGSLQSGRVVTEHHILEGAWYLDGERIPTCIAVEAGQADLLLSGYLGIDFITKGQAVYRLLDAEVTFYQSLPGPGNTIQYDIHIDEFFRQDETYLFRFRFSATVNGEPLLTMRKGCAGFFTQAELDGGRGIVHTKLDLAPKEGKVLGDFQSIVPMSIESYDKEQIKALRSGNLAGCFGSLFEGLPVKNPYTLPEGRMNLVDRVVHIDPKGGKYALGLIRSSADIQPDDWFLTCHFIDDMVMPGTLMYECCLHTLRIFLLRMGWVMEDGQGVYEPIPGVSSQLKCRGQVIGTTKIAVYEVTIKEIGYGPEPYIIADALLYADQKAIVKITNMSLRLKGMTKRSIESIWNQKSSIPKNPTERKPPLYDTEKILAFAVGKPSEAFGEPYKIFDSKRVIARLPGPPYQFLDRITQIQAEPWKMVSGGIVEAQYDIPPEEWYFGANRSVEMPFAVLLEIALQPCGWLAAYIGSALTSERDLSFRNLGGKATQYKAILPDSGTLTTRIKITGVSKSGGMIIQNYDFEMFNGGQLVYKGDTYFGFFSREALANQVGIQDGKLYTPDLDQRKPFSYPQGFPFPDQQMRMVDTIDFYIPDGGPLSLGLIQGSKKIHQEEWFFKAHFYQDPVWPGSLGLEAFLQILKVVAVERWGFSSQVQFEANVLAEAHQWIYRGQVLPFDDRVTIQAEITHVDDQQCLLFARGYLVVDGRIIYQMKDFSLRLRG